MLPQPKDDAEADRLDRSAPVFVEAVRQAFSSFVRSSDALVATASGSRPVFTVAEHSVAKLFAPIDRQYFSTELAALRMLAQQTDVPAPLVREVAEVDGWPCLLMSQLEGEGLDTRWPVLLREQRIQVSRALGAVTRRLHRLDAAEFTAGIDWNSFFTEQRDGCQARQDRPGVAPQLVAEIPAFLDRVELDADERVFLHTEIMPAHTFVAGDTCRITGLIDFEPSMLGPPEYDFASVGLFLSRGDPALWRAFLAGYGQEQDPGLHRRVMAWLLLHRYARMSWYLEWMPPANSLEQLARRWFGGEGSA